MIVNSCVMQDVIFASFFFFKSKLYKQCNLKTFDLSLYMNAMKFAKLLTFC